MKIFKILHITLLLFILVGLFSYASSITVYTITTASGPSYGVYANGKVYFIAQNSNELQVIQGNKIVENFSLPQYPHAVPFRITYDPNNQVFYIAYEKGPVIAWANGKVLGNYTIPDIGNYPAICYANGYVIVTASYGDKVYFINTGNNEVTSITVMSGPQALAYDNYTNIIYVGGFGSRLIYGISLNTLHIIYNFTINDTTVDAMTFVPPNIIAVATYEQQVEFLNASTGKIISVISLPPSLTSVNGYSSMIYVPYNGLIYLSVAHKNNVIVAMNLTSIVNVITVGISPNGLVYDPINHYIYVMNYGSNSVSYFNLQSATKPNMIFGINYTLFYTLIGIVVVVLVVIGIVVALRRRR